MNVQTTVPIRTPCCGAGITEVYLVTALCASCFNVVRIDGVMEDWRRRLLHFASIDRDTREDDA